jgi:hypothetical protein
MTRADWFQRLISRLRPRFKRAGIPIPAIVIADSGLRSGKGSRARKRAERKYDGECWPSNPPRIYIATRLDDTMDVANAFVHELVHAASTQEHDDEFFDACKAVGLRLGREPNLKTTTELGPRLRKSLERIVRDIGEYPA